ncbi:MAG TPA: ATP-binding protein [Syntrophorhabdaceae bacterium]
MINSETHTGNFQDEVAKRLIRWSGRELTGGGQQDVKMVTGHEPSPDDTDMAGIMQFASQIAHHFNNILSVMSGYGGLLKSKMEKDDPSLVFVEKMLASSLRAHDLVRSLLLFTGDEKSRLRQVDLNRVVKRAGRFLAFEKERIKTKVELHESSLFIMADVVRMEEVLANLIENARDAMPSGGTLTIRTEPVFTDEGLACGAEPAFVSLSVTDTGSGMDEGTREKVFEPFFTTKGPGTNMGLGLSKVYGIVKQHAGVIEVVSAPGEGSSIKIRLPLVERGRAVAEPIPLPDSVMGTSIPLCSSRWPV